MKILVTGANGQLGSEFRFLSLTNYKFNWIFTDIDKLDLIDFKNLNNKLYKINPDIIINCAAYTNVDNAETEKELANLLNFKAVDFLSKWTSKNKSKIIHISTDYVFDGNSSVPLKEDAFTSPINIYGKSKLKGEKICQKNDPNCLVIRTSWLYSSFGNNFVKRLASLMTINNSLNIVNDQFGSPTYARDLAEAIIKIINNKNWKPGVYHYSNLGEITWFDFAKSIKKYFGFNVTINGVSTKQFPTKAKRPRYSLLDNSKIQSTFNLSIPFFEYSLQKCIKILKNEK